MGQSQAIITSELFSTLNLTNNCVRYSLTWRQRCRSTVLPLEWKKKRNQVRVGSLLSLCVKNPRQKTN